MIPTFSLIFDENGFHHPPSHSYSQAETVQIVQDLLEVCVVLAEGDQRRLKRACLALGIPAPTTSFYTSRRAYAAINGDRL